MTHKVRSAVDRLHRVTNELKRLANPHKEDQE